MNFKKPFQILIILILIAIVVLPIVLWRVYWSQFTGGNEYLRHENISLDLSKNPPDTYSVVHNQLALLANQYDLEKHEFILPDHDKPRLTRFYKQEDLKDGVINVRYLNTGYSQTLSVNAKWGDQHYGEFYQNISRFIVEQNYDFSVPYTQRGETIISKITKDMVIQNNFE